MGSYPRTLRTKDNPSNAYERSALYDKRNTLARKKIAALVAFSYYLPATRLKTLMQQPDQPQRKDTFHEPVKDKISSAPIIHLPSTESDKCSSSTNVRFLLFDLEMRMNRTSKAMLHIIKSLMASELIIVKDFHQLERIISSKSFRICLFSSIKYADLLGNTLNAVEKVFVLGTSINTAYKAFENIQDLIFQVADEFAQLYREKAHEHEKLGEFTLAKCKHDTITDMYRRLMEVSTEEITINPSICTDTSLIWLTRNQNATNEENLIKIAPSLIVFDNEQTCWDYVVQCDDETAIFLLVDPNYDFLMVTRLEELPQVKQLYRTKEFIDINKLYFRLTHDLIKHYGQIGDQLKSEERNQEARQMFRRAQQLCQILFC